MPPAWKRSSGIVVDLRTGSAPDFATLSVALQAVRRLARD